MHKPLLFGGAAAFLILAAFAWHVAFITSAAPISETSYAPVLLLLASGGLICSFLASFLATKRLQNALVTVLMVGAFAAMLAYISLYIVGMLVI
jgi:hypothetical protein